MIASVIFSVADRGAKTAANGDSELTWPQTSLPADL